MTLDTLIAQTEQHIAIEARSIANQQRERDKLNEAIAKRIHQLQARERMLAEMKALRDALDPEHTVSYR